MASQYIINIIPLILTISQWLIISTSSQSQIDNNNLSKTLVFPITKDASTLQYLTKIRHGDPLLPTTLVLDLNGPYSWMDCGSSSTNPSRRIIPRGSIQCLAAAKKQKSGEDVSRCSLPLENKIGRVGNRGDLVEDIVAVDFVDRSTTKLLYVCSTKTMLHGLASGSHGMLGLGRERISIPSQVSSLRNSDWQFTMCLSSTNGVVLIENGRYSSYFGSQISKSIVYTQLLTGQSDSQHDYFFNLKSIDIGGKKLSLDIETTKLSTVVSYTTMRSPIYEVFTKAYERAALSMNMSRVGSVGAFGLCFGSSKPIGPEIDLVLQSELVKWRLSGRNSLVRVSDKVMCLGILDGGLDLEASIVLGGYQLEDVVLHFDVGNSMLGFSPSLLKWQKSCSDFKFESLPVESM